MHVIPDSEKASKTNITGELAASSHSSDSTSASPTDAVQSVTDDDLPEYAVAVECINSELYDDIAAHVSIWTILYPISVVSAACF